MAYDAADYDLAGAFEAIEHELIDSMMRNMKKHQEWETEEGFQWAQWQAEQLRDLERYRRQNGIRFNDSFARLNQMISDAIRQARATGQADQEVAILEAIQAGFLKGRQPDAEIAGQFFKQNDRKMDALIKATTQDMQRAEYAILRRANDEYRKIVFNAVAIANTGTFSYEQCIDMATKDMRRAGLLCVEYKNGARHSLEDYADMVVKTTTKRAYLTGEGEMRKEWGISTVIVNKRATACPRCLPWTGKVFIDDVWSGGKAGDGEYPLISQAMEAGLYHPRCKDSHTTYFPGISTADDKWTRKELEQLKNANKLEARQQEAERQAKSHERQAEFAMDPEERKKQTSLAEQSQKQAEIEAEKLSQIVEEHEKEKLQAKSIDQLSEDSTNALKEYYEERRIQENLNLTPVDEIPANMMQKLIKVDYGNVNPEVAERFNDTVMSLMDEYEAPVQRIIPMSKEEQFFSKTVPVGTSVQYETNSAEMRLNTRIMADKEDYKQRVIQAIQKGQFPDIPEELADQYVPTHEFAHAMMTTDSIPKKRNWSGKDFSHTRAAQKEVKALFESYKSELASLKEEKDQLYQKFFDGTISQEEADRLREVEARYKDLKISEYSLKSADEFWAEGFTDARLGKNPSEYSKKIQEIADRHFKKATEPGYLDRARRLKAEPTKTVEGYTDELAPMRDSDLNSIREKTRKWKRRIDTYTRSVPPIKLAEIEYDKLKDIEDIIDNADERTRRILNANKDQIVFAKTNAHGTAHYNRNEGIYVNLAREKSNKKGAYTTLFHEIGHCIDDIYGRPSENQLFHNMLYRDFSDFTTRYAEYYNVSISEAYEMISERLREGEPSQVHIISDLFSALSDGKCRGKYRHTIEYWRRKYALEHEAFAHFFSLKVVNNRELINSIRQVFPNSYNYFCNLMEEL